MGCEQVCLKWNNFSFNITKNIDDLWKDESLVDVSLISDGQCIQAHKVILSASSPLFKSLFAVNPCQHPVIILQDVRFRELVSIITFIYKGEVNIFEENLPALLQAAKTLQIRGLSDSVDRDSLDRLYSLRTDDTENVPSVKKRKINHNVANETQQATEECSTNVTEKIIPKEEPKLDHFPADFLTVSDDEDVKTDEIVLRERTDDMLQSDLAQTDDTALTSQCLNTFPCPFCHRTYTNWGFRRRHIISVHGKLALSCKWCTTSVFTLEEWIYHMLDEHKIDSNEVQRNVAIYKEAKIVLQDTETTTAHDQNKQSTDCTNNTIGNENSDSNTAD